ncbi:MAG: glycosyl hydrolase family 28 protein [Armatimonadota bacterium]
MDTQSVVTPNDFQGSDVERINRALAAAAGTGRRVVIPRRNLAADGERDLWLLDSAILLPGGTVLELDNCHLKLSDACRDNFMRSANCGEGIAQIEPLRGIHIRGRGGVLLEGADRPRATGDGAKTLGERTFGTDANVAEESQSGDWRNIGVLMAFVEDFSVENIAMKDSHAWAISLERCAHGRLRDLDFASTGKKMIDGTEETILNQDGIDLRLGCHDILIENITGYTGDDLIALTAIPNPDRGAGELRSTMVSGAQERGDGLDDIRQVIIRNVRGYCAGGHHIVRLLNTSGACMYDIILDGLIDTSPAGMRCKAAVKIGDDRYGGGIAPVGDTSRVMVSNVVSRSEHTILIGGSLTDSIISNVIRHDSAGEPVSVASGREYVRDVAFVNLHVQPTGTTN